MPHGSLLLQEALIPLLSRNVGFGMGLEFREGTHVLPLPGSGKAAAAGEDGAPRVRAGMVFNVCLGVAGLTNADASDPKAKNYALQVMVGASMTPWPAIWPTVLAHELRWMCTSLCMRPSVMQVADTIVVVDGDRPNEVATQSAPKNFDKVTYTIQVSYSFRREFGMVFLVCLRQIGVLMKCTHVVH